MSRNGVVLLFLTLNFSISFFSNELLAERCFKDPPISINTSSASIYGNFWERDGTVIAESRRLLNLADLLLDQNAALGRSPTYLFESKPTKYLQDYQESEICEQKLRLTLIDPIRFETVSFPEADDVMDWFSDIGQGSGELGEKLYDLCPGDCSPSYKLYISKSKSGLEVETEVVCGHARDKDDNTYQISLKESKKC